jgi:hypothetical protein
VQRPVLVWGRGLGGLLGGWRRPVVSYRSGGTDVGI